LFSGLAALSALYGAQPMAQSGRFSAPVLALITFGVLAAFEAALPLPLAYQMLGRIRTAAERLLEVSEADKTVDFPTTSAPLPAELSIRYQGVGFSYPGSSSEKNPGHVVTEIDLSVPVNSTVALVGPSGSGKTTLAHLLTRFWDPEEGKITIGGVNLRRFSESQLRGMVTLVSQKAHIFSASLLDNLLIADPQAEDAALWAALERAQLAEFASRLPEGLATLAGEGGASLSGGEARRLILARALLKNAPIWVLDEPTEGLDNHSRRRFTETLFANLAGKSALLITHTVEILERVDQVCFLEQGRIVACGAHAQLLRECPRYRHFIGCREQL
jgi:ATP-binding cassette subfamily C protein CydC